MIILDLANATAPVAVLGIAIIALLDTLEEQLPDLVFADIRMPGRSGLDLLADHVRVLDGRYAGPIVFEVRPIGDEDPWAVIAGARKALAAAVAAAHDHPSRRS